jgi:hypothetical protein
MKTKPDPRQLMIERELRLSEARIVSVQETDGDIEVTLVGGRQEWFDADDPRADELGWVRLEDCDAVGVFRFSFLRLEAQLEALALFSDWRDEGMPVELERSFVEQTQTIRNLETGALVGVVMPKSDLDLR